MLSEDEIIRGCKKFDDIAQKALYKMFVGKMYAVCCRYIVDKDVAKDVLQESFIKVFTKFDQYKGDNPLGAWIRRIVVNHALSHLKRTQSYLFENIEDLNRLEEGTTESALISGEDESDTLLDKKDFTLEELHEAIHQLPENLQIVFNLYAIEKYSHKEVSEMLQIKIEVSRIRLMRARKFLQDYLARIELKKRMYMNG